MTDHQKPDYTAASMLAALPDRPMGPWRVPFTARQVQLLDAYQRSGQFHPYTCGDHSHRRGPLTPTADGWRCPEEGCLYTQDWAHPIPDSIAAVLLAPQPRG